MPSRASWIPLLWVLIVGTRSVSLWFGGALQMQTPEDYLEGSPLDRNVYLLLIAAGLVVLWRRKVNWGTIFASNRWVFAFVLYCGISVMWSDYPFASFKRWIKDLGNVVMVLLLFTEEEPAQATKAVFMRYAYLAIPLSVVLIRYFPDLGRYYDRWTYEPIYCGIATEKNALGCLTFIGGLFLIWDAVYQRPVNRERNPVVDVGSRVVLLVMALWLLHKANSSTAIVCLMLGTGILLYMRIPRAKRQVRHLGTWCVSGGLLLLVLFSVPGAGQALLGMLGEDTTLTGRTDLWAELLREPINPVLGTGYQSFWGGPMAKHYWDKYYFHPTSAHNGYLETYLDGGWVGVVLLVVVLFSTAGKLKKELLLGSNFGFLRFSFLVVAIFYNWTEAAFNRLGPVWVVLLIAALQYPASSKSVAESMVERREDGLLAAGDVTQSKRPTATVSVS
jgi:exopolysaccharide production protein ExoQ